MTARILYPGLLHGTVTPPVSKSLLHRILIARVLAGESLPAPWPGEGEDLAATRRCLSVLTEQGGDGLPEMDCGQSASTLRFLLPLALSLRGGGRFKGSPRLFERPLEPYLETLGRKGVRFCQDAGSLLAEGRLPAGEYVLPGDVSSQFVTGLLFALPTVAGESRITLTGRLVSGPYVDLTMEVLCRAGILVNEKENTFTTFGKQMFKRFDWDPETDWSQAAFWYAANFLGSCIEIKGLNPKSLQGDRRITQWYPMMERPGDLRLDLGQNPDLLPAVALMAAARTGKTCLVNAGRLRNKESDRIRTSAGLLAALGASVDEREDGLVLNGPCRLQGGVTVNPSGDHRIAMMAAVAATVCESPVVLTDADCVCKSYPEFWNHYHSLGGKSDVLISG